MRASAGQIGLLAVVVVRRAAGAELLAEMDRFGSVGPSLRIGKVGAHHHLLLPHQQVGEGILQLGMHQTHVAGGAAHIAQIIQQRGIGWRQAGGAFQGPTRIRYLTARKERKGERRARGSVSDKPKDKKRSQMAAGKKIAAKKPVIKKAVSKKPAGKKVTSKGKP